MQLKTEYLCTSVIPEITNHERDVMCKVEDGQTTWKWLNDSLMLLHVVFSRKALKCVV